MVAARFAPAIKERHPGAGRPSTRVEQELRDIIQQAEHATEIVPTEMPVWYYWMPCPGVRYYSYEPWLTARVRLGRSLADAPTGR